MVKKASKDVSQILKYVSTLFTQSYILLIKKFLLVQNVVIQITKSKKMQELK